MCGAKIQKVPEQRVPLKCEKNSEKTTDKKMIIVQKVILKVKISKTGEDRWIRGDSIKGKGRSQLEN